jgi:hypothetical protein
MDEIEQQSKQIRYNAEQLENLCSDRMAQLYQEKRKSKKQYQEEHAKIASQFAHVSYKLFDLFSFCESHAMHQQVLRNHVQILWKYRKKVFESESASFCLFDRDDDL